VVTDKDQANQTDYELINSLSVAAFDLDGRIFRTLWHSFIRAPDVALAAIKGDYTRYISPIRVVIALVGVQFAVAAIFGTPMTLSVETISADLDAERLAGWLNGHDVITVDRALEDAMSLLIWPITLASSLPYLILLKLYRPSLKFWTHVCVFLVPTNASTFAFVLLIPAFMLSDSVVLIAFITMLLVYFATTGWLIARFYSRSILGTVLRIVGLVLLLPVSLIISSIGQALAAGWILDSQFGLSLLDLFQ
tara:strand:- start:2062 stop:2814 length:753 start_codon:yes stop_codon:yes gene_type:complete